MVTVYTLRLLESTAFMLKDRHRNYYCIWDGNKVTVQDVLNYINAGGTGTTESYGDMWRYQPMKHDKQYHVARVAWYVMHPDEIKEIWVDNYCKDGALYPGVVIQDGNHRLFAAYIAKKERIKIHYGGRCDIENYLKGRRKTKPTDII